MFVRSFISDILQGRQSSDGIAMDEVSGSTSGQNGQNYAVQSRKAAQFAGKYEDEKTSAGVNSYDEDAISEGHTETSCSRTCNSNMNSVSIRSNSSHYGGRRDVRDVSPQLRGMNAHADSVSKDPDSVISSCGSEISIQRMAAQSRIAAWGADEEDGAEFELVIDDMGAAGTDARSTPLVAELGGGSNGKARSESRGKFRFVSPTTDEATSEVATAINTGINRSRRRVVKSGSIGRGGHGSSARQGTGNSSCSSSYNPQPTADGAVKLQGGDEAGDDNNCAQFRLHCVNEEESASAARVSDAPAAATVSTTVTFPALPSATARTTSSSRALRS